MYSTKNRPVAGVEKSKVSYKLASDVGMLTHSVPVPADFDRTRGMGAVADAIRTGAKVKETCPLAELAGTEKPRHSVELSGKAALHVADYLASIAGEPDPKPEPDHAAKANGKQHARV